MRLPLLYLLLLLPLSLSAQHDLAWREIPLPARVSVHAGDWGWAEDGCRSDSYYPEEDYRLVFQDEFNGPALDTSKWLPTPGDGAPFGRAIIQHCRWPDHVFMEENVSLQNGDLGLAIKRQAYLYQDTSDIDYCELVKGQPFERQFPLTAGGISTKWPHNPRYVRVEMRCKLPKGPGLQGAFWLIGHGNQGVGKEIDVFEIFDTWDRPREYCIDLHHYTQPHYRNPLCLEVEGPDLTEDFHEFVLEWEVDRLRIYVDGEMVRQFHRFWLFSDRKDTPPRPVSCGDSIPAQPGLRLREFVAFPDGWMNVILSTGVHLEESEAAQAFLAANGPAVMWVDYLRVYQKVPEADGRNLCYLTLDGPELLCNGDTAVFTVRHGPRADELPLAISDNLQLIDIEDGKIRVAPFAAGKSGPGWVEIPATGLPAPCPQSLRRELWIGPPPPPELAVEPIPCTGTTLQANYPQGRGFRPFLILENATRQPALDTALVFFTTDDPTLPVTYGVGLLNACGSTRTEGTLPAESCDASGYRLWAYPNPVRDRLSVRLEGFPAAWFAREDHRLELIDPPGRTVAVRLVEGPLVQWELPDLPAGVYRLRARVAGNVIWSDGILLLPE